MFNCTIPHKHDINRDQKVSPQTNYTELLSCHDKEQLFRVCLRDYICSTSCDKDNGVTSSVPNSYVTGIVCIQQMFWKYLLVDKVSTATAPLPRGW